MGKQMEPLKHHPHLPPDQMYLTCFIRNPFPVNDNLSACRRLQQVEAAQKRGLARSGRADNGYDFSFFDFGVDIL